MQEKHQEVIKKIELEYQDDSNDSAIFELSSPFCFCVKKRNSNPIGEIFFSFQLNVWIGCVVLQRMKSKTKKNPTQDNQEKLKVCFDNMFRKMVLKDNEYDWDKSYLYSSQRNQNYVQLSAISANWVSVAKKEKHSLIICLIGNLLPEKICWLTRCWKENTYKVSRKLNVFREKTWQHIVAEILSLVGFQRKESNQKSLLKKPASNKWRLKNSLEEYSW